MKLSLNRLRVLISEVMSRVLREEEKDEFIKRNASVSDWRENEDDHFEEEIEELRSTPEFKDTDTFINYKLANDELSFSAAELQALARNLEAKKLGVKQVTMAGSSFAKSVKDELVDFGFEFKPREKVKHVRGSMSSAHGTSPWAGMGGGGSGFGGERSNKVGGFTSMGGGPGAIGGGYDWDPNDKKNLGMAGKNVRKKT